MSLPLLSSSSYKWIFVGGKGGVGKTSTSCSLAVALSRVRSRVLLVSTDPASNIGDAFQQHFTSEPQLVKGFQNLWAMEAPNCEIKKSTDDTMSHLFSFPGIDEIKVLSSLFQSVENDDYDLVIFDTAPTGHTMRLLQLPTSFKGILGAMGSLQDNPLMTAASGLMGGSSNNMLEGLSKLETLLNNAAKRLSNPMECTFVCVLLPEFLPLYETERLIQFLGENHIETHVLVVNQVIREVTSKHCKLCSKRYQNQQKYMKEIYSLYDDFQIAEIPLQESEIKGVAAVQHFSDMLSPLVNK